MADEDKSRARAVPPRRGRSDKLREELETFVASTLNAFAELNASLRDLRTLTSEEGYATRSRLNALDQRITRLERASNTKGRSPSNPRSTPKPDAAKAPSGKDEEEEASR